MHPTLHGWLHRYKEAWPLASLLLLALGGLALHEIWEMAFEGGGWKFDAMILRAMHDKDGSPLGPLWFESVMRDFTGLAGFGVLLTGTAALCGYLWLIKKRHMIVLMLVCVFGGLALGDGVKFFFERKRPDLFEHATFVTTTSFPSGHATAAAATYLTLGVLLARVQEKKRLKAYCVGVAVMLTIMIGISRVYLGVHWPTDVMAGWTVGAMWALLCLSVARWLQRRGAVERPGEQTP